MWPSVQAPIGPATIEDRIRTCRDLAVMCGVPEKSVESCDENWCVYYDPATLRCALLMWDVESRLGPEALRWFASHRGDHPAVVSAADEALDDVLAARCASL